ncbi:DNA polymerase-3 subunit alpha [Pseudobutyrivibrio sp. NOR37]|uniref:DNA polymerase III subunit alpha n=2 Tax=Pseudobutyrivibrio TaxID=46205 RepID=A0A6M0LK53_PSEXY|nr:MULTISPECIES: DNA polymerase III subunit alpha [Pseudobutyrivibrio]NEX02894.1 DNA polymerase III subunit alpha [Pseudobutyrivibrio xylanivorans]SFR86304.1 DNA polymerase-3 subunit alpha [Pseudobutyrivibrio sp. NOR37]
MSFVHLHTHTEYSLLDGSNKIKSYVKKCVDMGMTAAAITDHGNMYGVVDFYKECKNAGINPVIGCEVYVAPGSRFDRERVQGEDRYYHLILLAENNAGYQNLIKIVSAGYVDGYYYKPRVDFEILEKYHEGIICLSACLAGEVARALNRQQYDEAKAVAHKYLELFGEGNYYLEMQDHGIPEQQTVNQGLMRLSRETGIPLVVTNDCHYTNREDADSHDVLLCIQTGKKLNDEDRMRFETQEFYVKSEEEMLELFPYAKEAVARTQEIADRCHVEFEFGVTKLPHFEVPEGYDSWTYLNKLCYEGLDRRYGDRAEELKPRLEYELDVIKNMGYVDYFLIVWDFINYARTHGIPVGPGRGSAAGALVSYTTGITNIDPIKYSLVFERFLNPERVSMPDIDIDFCFERRSEVIDYVVRKYGKDCVTQIVTFGTLKARGVIRDVGRVMDLPYGYVDSVAKMIPTDLGVTLDKALSMNPELKALYEADDQVRNLIDVARTLEGLPRNTGMHAAGVVIAGKPMDEYVPLSRGGDGTIVTQFVMTTIEELGLLKMDFLGLRTLTVINDAVKLVEKNYGKKLNMDEIDYNDQAVMDMISAGKCEGVFQLESTGMKNFMKELKPHSIEDVIAGISLYRPGPMDFIPDYIKGKNSGEEITYDCPQLEPILAPTYGCIVYQEQVMQIVQQLAGYSLGGADEIRRAMSKKKQYVIEENREIFVNGGQIENHITGKITKIPGCVANGISAEVANKIYDHMVDFAKYAFNKSHAAAYAVVAIQTAYLKRYYPLEFMAALMTSVIDNNGKVSEYIAVCRTNGIDVLPPDVNSGSGRFSVDDGKIRYGLYAIKSVGRNTIDAIIYDREKNGPFRDLEDFINRVSNYDANKRTIENLIKSGALDSMEGNRRQKCLIFPSILDSVNSGKKNNIQGQMSLFDFANDEQKEDLKIALPEAEEFDKEIKLALEKELMGVYVSGHPLDDYIGLLEKNITAKASQFMVDDETGQAAVEDDSVVVIGGMISGVTIKYTKQSKAMAFINLEDLTGTVEVVIFPNSYEKARSLISEGNKVFIQGRVQVEEEKDAKLICQDIKSFDDCGREVWIRFANKDAYEAAEGQLTEIIRQMDGSDGLAIYLTEEKAIKRMGPNWTLAASLENLEVLYQNFGQENVQVVEKKIKFDSGKRRY